LFISISLYTNMPAVTMGMAAVTANVSCQIKGLL